MNDFIIRVGQEVHDLIKDRAKRDRRTIKDTTELLILEALNPTPRNT